jgi:3-oxoacyl-(acyl-carrier-protein) synthase
VVTDIARELRLEGPQSTHSVACVSSACALGEALLWLRAGLVERALVVGTDALCRLTMAGFSSLKVIDAEGCRPFTEERAGMSLGEAGAALLLETGSAAARRGATAIARFAGWSISTDAQHPSTPDAEGTWLEQAIRESIADAGLGADGLSMVCAHGTGTRNNDEAEAKALARSLPGVPVASYKRIYGHCMGAAAALEAVLCCEMIRRRPRGSGTGVGLGQALGQVPVQQDFQEDVPVDAVLSTNAAFGGVNTALVFTRAD